MNALEIRTQAIVAEVLGFDAPQVELANSLVNDLRADSVDAFMLMTALEEEFAIDIDEDDMVQIETVADIVGYLRSQGCQ